MGRRFAAWCALAMSIVFTVGTKASNAADARSPGAMDDQRLITITEPELRASVRLKLEELRAAQATLAVRLEESLLHLDVSPEVRAELLARTSLLLEQPLVAPTVGDLETMQPQELSDILDFIADLLEFINEALGCIDFLFAAAFDLSDIFEPITEDCATIEPGDIGAEQICSCQTCAMNLTFLAEAVDDLCDSIPLGNFFCGNVDTVFEVAGFIVQHVCHRYECKRGIDEACQDDASWAEVFDSVDEVLADTAALQDGITNVQDTADQILNEVQCIPVGALIRQHGCDGVDNDCNDVIDDCTEDTFPPFAHLDAAVSVPWFPNVATAAAAVGAAVVAFDDCHVLSIGQPSLSGSCGSVLAAVEVLDACGNLSVASATIKVDGTKPTIAIPASVAEVCYASVAAAEVAVLAAASITDDCSSGASLDVSITSTVVPCGLRIKIDATDAAGNHSFASTTVRVDPDPPFVEVNPLLLGFRGEVLAFQTPPCFATVADAEQAVLQSSSSTDGCTRTVATAVASGGPPCGLLVTVTGTDECGLSSMDQLTVRVDDMAPTVSCAVEEDTLWPSNHAMIDVGFSYTATDNCAGPIDVSVTITSDEPTASAPGSGQTSPAPDAHIRRDVDGNITGVILRAERSTAGDGRVYGIRLTARDACGHRSSASCFVSVPPTASGSAIDSGQFYDATLVN